MDIQELATLFGNKDVKSLCNALFKVDLTKMQEEIVKSVAYADPENKRVIISCMTRYGKSFCVSMGVLLWILMNRDKKVAIVAPTNEKTTIIRNNIGMFISRSKIFINLVDISSIGRLRISKEASRKRITWKNGVELRTLSAEGTGEALMGFGADLLIVDEICDIDYAVYQMRISRMLGDSPSSRYVGIGNPWHRDNQMWNQYQDPNFKKINIDYKIAISEGRADAIFIEEQRKALTPSQFKVLYEAEFPENSVDALILWSWIEKSLKRPSIEKEIEIIFGCDIAEQGDDSTVISVVKRNILDEYELIDMIIWNKEDLMPTTGRIVKLIKQYNPDKVIVDAVGVGSGVYSRLYELSHENEISCQIVSVKAGSKPTKKLDKLEFSNLKAQFYWRLRTKFENGEIKIIDNRRLTSELMKMKHETTSSSKIRILDPGVAKDDTSQRKSPDCADSLCLAVSDFNNKMIFHNMAGILNNKPAVVLGGKSMPIRI